MVGRLGWSDASPEAARAHAQQRVEEALTRLIAGEAVSLMEKRFPPTWPEADSRSKERRTRWIENYTTKARDCAACRHVEDGSTRKS